MLKWETIKGKKIGGKLGWGGEQEKNGENFCNVLSSFVLNPKSNGKRKDTIRCELKNDHLGSNVYHGFEGRS